MTQPEKPLGMLATPIDVGDIVTWSWFQAQKATNPKEWYLVISKEWGFFANIWTLDVLSIGWTTVYKAQIASDCYVIQKYEV